jgi:hypothetical protein
MAERKYTLGKEQIIDNWSAFVENGAGRDQRLLDTVEQAIKDSNIPNIICYQAEVSSGFFSKRRTFLLVGLTSHRNYHVFIYSRDIGIHLDVGWYLTFAPSFFKLMISRNPRNLSRKIKLFARQEVSGFVSVVHHCVMNTTKKLYEELSLDPTGMNTKSNGFLSVW